MAKVQIKFQKSPLLAVFLRGRPISASCNATRRRVSRKIFTRYLIVNFRELIKRKCSKNKIFHYLCVEHHKK